jgi:hypothetical protein
MTRCRHTRLRRVSCGCTCSRAMCRAEGAADCAAGVSASVDDDDVGHTRTCATLRAFC